MTKRIVFSIILLVSILIFPIWVSAVLAVFGALYFKVYLEAILLFLISDMLFGVREPKFLGLTLFSVLCVTLAVFLIEFSKKKLKFYGN